MNKNQNENANERWKSQRNHVAKSIYDEFDTSYLLFFSLSLCWNSFIVHQRANKDTEEQTLLWFRFFFSFVF